MDDNATRPDDRYVVTITQAPRDVDDSVRRLTDLFGIDEAKARKFVARLPREVTKALPEDEAHKFAERFRQAGLEPVVRPATERRTPTRAPTASTLQKTPRPAEPPSRKRRQTDPSDTLLSEGLEPKRRGSLRNKLLSVAVIPTLLTIVIALVVTWFTARPALYDQLLESARNPAIATAASLSSTLADGSDAEQGIDYLQLQETILITRQAFQRQNISFIVATDTEGNPLSAWFAGAASLSADNEALRRAIQGQAQQAMGNRESRGNAEVLTEQLAGIGGTRIEIVSQPLLSGGNALGAIVVGVTDDAVRGEVLAILINIMLFSLVPVLIAILVSVWRARSITNDVDYLTEIADGISRGALDQSVKLQRNDELDSLAEAIERLRISSQISIERLKRRR